MMSDKIMHFCVCLLATAIGSMVLGPIVGFGAGMGIAIGKEVLDKEMGGQMSRDDLLADYFGVGAGLILYLIGFMLA